MTDNKLTDKLSPREMAIFIDAIDRRGWSAEATDYMVQVVAYLRAPVAQRADSDAIAQWLNTPEGKAAVANAVTLANEAAERLADARRIDPAMLNTPFAATSAPAEKGERDGK